MSWILTTVYVVIETRIKNDKKKKTKSVECDSREEAENAVKNMSEIVASYEIDEYYLDSDVRIDSYRWSIKEESKLILK